VKADHPGVGQNLSNHLRYALRYEVTKPITAYRYYHPIRAILGGTAYLGSRRGFLASTALPVSGVVRTGAENTRPTFKASLSTALFGNGTGPFGMLPKAHGFSVLVYACSPFSRGNIRLRSSNYHDTPMINSNYLTDERDLPLLVDAAKRMRAIVGQPALSKLVKREMQPNPPGADSSDIEANIRGSASNVYHPVGTCRVGEDNRSVVDPYLRVRGVEGLRIADTSVLPACIGSGTYAMALMVGEKAAAMISRG
jgi:choline dehydrogenase